MYPAVHARKHPERIAVRVGGGPGVTYKELDERSVKLARELRWRGLQVGDGVAVLAENHERYFEIYWAAVRSGYYITAINRHSTPDEAAYIMADSGSKALICSHGLRETAVGLLPLLKDGVHRLMFDGVIDGFECYENLLERQRADSLVEEPRGQLMLYSSGTTGQPKGVKRALTGLRVDDPAAPRNSDLIRKITSIDQDSVYLVPGPLYHAAAFNWSIAVQEIGGTVVVMPKWDPEHFLALIENQGVTHTQVVPTMMVRLLKLDPEVRARHDMSSLKGLLHSAAPCPVDVKHAMLDWLGPIVDEYYTGTEGNGVTFIAARDWQQRPGSVGRPVIGIIHICDDDGQELATGEVGTVYFERSGTVFGYHNDAAKTAGAMHPDHPTWSTIGDMGRVDEDNYLFLTDRKAFMIISGGVNIYPAEIEGRMVMHPAVADVAVFGLPDADMGEYVHAVVQPTAGVAATAELAAEIIDFARDGLSRYKVPRVLDFLDELPRLESGKLRKDVLRADYLSVRSSLT
ncbi:acyl-CoA synthetase [Rhodococcus globerulus]|uniref:acyl-CoA synthetase n=1 Tax=Rhodococcus globerulus TaxID=33008 RepID=UPI001F41E0C5|nr:acyl-CoA synthetase [Rhodococcus globerulus]MCE4265283.1 acyl-CoA synthetase [Rhodococcus globerulus]